LQRKEKLIKTSLNFEKSLKNEFFLIKIWKLLHYICSFFCNHLPHPLDSSIETCHCYQAGADDADSEAVHRFSRIFPLIMQVLKENAFFNETSFFVPKAIRENL
jgi:hypothetical protein